MRENKSMTWFSILSNFILFISAIIFIYNSYHFFSGDLHNKNKTLFYWIHPTLKVLDIIVGVLYVLLAAYTVYTRFQLIKFSVLSQNLLTGVYLVPSIINIIYLVLVFLIIGFDFDASILSYIFQFVPSIIIYLILVVENKKYIEKRSELFVNK